MAFGMTGDRKGYATYSVVVAAQKGVAFPAGFGHCDAPEDSPSSVDEDMH